MYRGILALLMAVALALAGMVPRPAVADDEEKPDVRIEAPLSTEHLFTAAAAALKQSRGLRIQVTPVDTSLEALAAVAQGDADIGVMTRPLTGVDRANYPSDDLVTVPIGVEVAALGVSNDLWDAGVRSITKERMRDIYEQKIRNWREAGGPDEKISLFNFAEGQGIWEIFAEWLYGDARKAPFPKTEKVTSSEDAQATLEFGSGTIAPIAAIAADGVRCHALGISVSGKVVAPTPATVASGAYPMARGITAVVVGRPTLDIRAVTEFMTSATGQAMVRKSGDYGLNAVPSPTPEPSY